MSDWYIYTKVVYKVVQLLIYNGVNIRINNAL
jgi:hypothetical protein